jgi:hypothetical protein
MYFGGSSNLEDRAPIKADDESTSTDTPGLEPAPSSSSNASHSETTAPVAESTKAVQGEDMIPLPVNIRLMMTLLMMVEKKKACSWYAQLLINGFTF